MKPKKALAAVSLAVAMVMGSGCVVRDDEPDAVGPSTVIHEDRRPDVIVNKPPAVHIEQHTHRSSTTTGGTTNGTEPTTGSSVNTSG
jgi:hypothetical protein